MPGIEGVTITADALHCQRETCDLIVQEGGSYCLQLKGNQGDMKADVRAFIDDQETDYIDEYTSTDADHGRVETRCTRVCTAPKHLDDTHRWPSLKAFVHAIPTRELNGKSRQSEQVCLMSNCPSAREAAAMIRGHWQIENNLHWSLDVTLNDDQHRARKDNAPINFAALGRIALNIMKANTDKGSDRVKFERAGWKDDFLRTPIKDF